MQAIINMAQALLDQGREFWEQDRYQDATRVLNCLLGFRVIPPEIAERAQFYLGDMQLAQGCYSKARRHLAAAIGCGAGSGETHFLMACALDWDDEPDLRNAYRHYRKAVELEPGQPLYSSAYALVRIRSKRGKRPDQEAVRRLRAAFAASPDDPDIVHNYVFGLIEVGSDSEAELALRRARKQWPQHPAFESLWHDFLTRRDARPAGKGNKRSTSSSDCDGPILLPFPATRSPEKPPSRLTGRSSLRTALSTLNRDEVGALARALGLPELDSSDRGRTAIRQTLLNHDRLERIFQTLSGHARRLVQTITLAGGNLATRRFLVRVDRPATHGPHFRVGQPDRALNELRRMGLVYVAAPKARGTETLVIPSDLRRALAEIRG